MGYSDATWRNVAKVVDTIGDLSAKQNDGNPGAAVTRRDVVTEIMPKLGIKISRAYGLIDTAAILGLVAKLKPTDQFADQRQRSLQLTGDGLIAYQQSTEQAA